MSKPIVPVLAFLVVLGVALLMIAGIVVRPWELPQARQVSLASSSAYGRSMLSYVGSDSNIGWQHPAQIEPAGNGIGGQPPISGDHYSGRDYFISYGCASCHGLNGQGTRWAPMRVTAPEQVHMMVRIGPGGMPAYSKDYLPDSTVDLMAGWLVEAAASKPAPPPTAASTPPATSTPAPAQPPTTSTVAAPVSTPPATGTTVPPQTTTPAPAAPAT
ncbi:MAG: cytochrome c, partial [Chloroflexi bacterium]|nr:cytochrome c [Chloroflexota bacterium]